MPDHCGRVSAIARVPRSARQRHRDRGPRRTRERLGEPAVASAAVDGEEHRGYRRRGHDVQEQEDQQLTRVDPYTGSLWEQPRPVFSKSVWDETRNTWSDSVWEAQEVNEEDGEDSSDLPPARSWKDMKSEGGSWQTFSSRERKNPRPVRRLKDSKEVEDLLNQIKGHLKNWPATGVAMGFLRLGKIAGHTGGLGVQEAVSQLTEATRTFRLQEIRTRDLARFIEAWGLLRHTPKGELMKNVCNTLEHRLTLSRNASEPSSNDLNPSGLTGVVFGLSLLGYKHEGLLTILCEIVPDRLFEFSSLELAKMLYSFARMDYRNREYLLAMGDHVPHRLKEFSAQEISNSVYAMWLLKFRHRKFLTGVCEHIPERLPEFNVQNIANTAYAIGKLEFRHTKFIRAISLHVATRIRELNKEKAITNVLRSLKTLQSLMDVKKSKR